MPKCKDCLHYEACSTFSKIINSAVDVETGCEHFKNRTDFAELVRCKDCKYKKFFHINRFGILNCESTKDDDYCSFGERKTNG